MRQDPSLTAESDEVSSDDFQSRNTQVLQDYRQRYGLSVDPFGDDPYFPFFTGGQRRELLDQIIHCCEFGAGVPIILGERGVGKTRAALALQESIGEDQSCFIDALPTMDAKGVLLEIAQYFELGEDAESITDLTDALQNYGQFQESDALAVVVIDDAHHLDDHTLMALLGLLQSRTPGDYGLQLALFGDLTLITRLQQLDTAQLQVSDFYIERFSLGETVDYLNFRMEMADYLGPEMFSELLAEPWWRQAQGQLPVIHRFAQEHLLEAVLPPISTGARPFPILHIVAIALLGAAVLMTLLYQSDKSEEQSAEVQRVPINLQPPQSVTPVAESAPTAQDVATNTLESSLAPAELSSQPGGVTEETATKAELQIDLEQGAPTVSSAPQVAVEKPEVVREPPVASVPAEVIKPKPAPEPTQVARKLSGDEETLLSWRSSDFTLQLLGVSTEKAARDFIANQPNRDDLLMFKTLRQGKDWFVVVAGRYETAAAARGAVKELPQEQAKAGPWPRELKVIHQEIQR